MKYLAFILLAAFMNAMRCHGDVTLEYNAIVADVIDGNTIIVTNRNITPTMEKGVSLLGNHSIILDMVDAPELDQPEGTNAKQYLAELIKGKLITVIEHTDRDKSRGAWIYIDGKCVNELLVINGYAWPCDSVLSYCTTKPKPDIEKAILEAKSKKRAIWAKENPVPPWEWRKRK